MITQRTFFWRFAMMPIVLPAICGLIIWLLGELVGLSGVFAGVLMFVAGSGLIGGLPYLLTLIAVFIYTRLLSKGNKNYVRIGFFMPIIFTLFMHTCVLVLSVLDNAKSLRTESFLQLNLNFIALDIVSLIVASAYTLAGWMLLRRMRKNYAIGDTDQ